MSTNNICFYGQMRKLLPGYMDTPSYLDLYPYLLKYLKWSLLLLNLGESISMRMGFDKPLQTDWQIEQV